MTGLKHKRRPWLVIGALNAALAVLLGAFAAHGLARYTSNELVHTFETAARYHFYHALGLCVLGLLPGRTRLRDWVGGLMLAGIVLFAGSLYLLSLTGTRWLGFVTPFGGIALISAWLLFALAAWRLR